MKQFSLNDINVHLFYDDLSTKLKSNFLKENAIVVQNVNYTCSRKRDGQGCPYGSTEETVLDFSIIASSKNQLTTLYDRIKEKTSSTLTFVYSPTYAEKELQNTMRKELDSYNRALAVSGYVVEINEVYGYGDSRMDYDNSQIPAYNGFIKELDIFKAEVENLLTDLDKEVKNSSFPIKKMETHEPLMIIHVKLLVDSIQYISMNGNKIQLFINF